MTTPQDTLVPPVLTDALADTLAGESVEAAIQTAIRHDFTEEDRGLVWLLLTGTRLIVAAASGEHSKIESTPIPSASVFYKKGVLRDAIVIADKPWELPTGYGARGRAFFEQLEAAIGHHAEGEVALVAHAGLDPIGALHVESAGDRAPTIKAALAPGERVLGMLPGQPVRDDVSEAWLVVTTHHSALVEFLEDDRIRHTGFVAQEISIETSTLGRDKIHIVGAHALGSPMMNRGGLRRLVELAAMRPVPRLIASAREHMKHELWSEAANILLAATRALPPEPTALNAEEADLDLEDQVLDFEEESASSQARLAARRARPLSADEEIIMLRARCAMASGNDAEAITRLEELTTLRPTDDLIETTRAEVSDAFGWWLLLAIAHEGANDHICAARVYEHLANHESGGAIFWLQRARALARSQQTEEALASYARFLDARLASDDFQLTSLLMQEVDDLSEAGADPHVVEACLELGELCEARAEWPRAASTYLTLIRQAPFNPRGYERLFAMAHRLEGEPHARATLSQVACLLRLLNPTRAAAIQAALERGLPEDNLAYPIPPELVGVLSGEDHDAIVTHEGERATRALAQRWLGDLISDAESTRDIERHCQLVTERSHEVLAKTITEVSRHLEITAPRCFLSHGLTGIQVLGHGEAPFLLLGAGHLDEDHLQGMDPRELAFAVASQLEHIRAGHLLLTSSEFWGAFRDRALTGAVALLSLIPIGGFLGKLADGVAGGMISKLKDKIDGKTLKTAVDFAEKKLKEGAASDGFQSAYEASLGQVFALGVMQARKDEESLLKEQLADFARCAMYTADRMGLLVCDDLDAAVRAILLLSARTAPEASALSTHGLEALLQKKSEDGALANQELALRFGELFKFATSSAYFDLRARMHAESNAREEGEEE